MPLEVNVKERPRWIGELSFDRLLLAVGVPLLAICVLGLFPALEGPILLIVDISCILAFGFGVFRHSPSPTWAWRAATAALVTFMVGAILRLHYHTMGNTTASRNLTPDFVSISAYLILFLGIGGLVWRRSRGRRGVSDALLSGLMAALSLCSVAWVFILGPILSRHHAPMVIRLVLISYPALSLFAVLLVVQLAATSRQERSRSYWYLLFAVGGMLLGDCVSTLTDSDLIHVSTIYPATAYSLAFLFAASCALHPSVKQLGEPYKGERQRFHSWQIVLTAVALLVPPVVSFGAPSGTGSYGSEVVLFILDVSLVGVAITRIVEALLVERRSKEEVVHQAIHDPLTGLANRRQMAHRLEEALQSASSSGAYVGVIFIDLDQFKSVNDTFGHTYGDKLLMEVAQRLRASTPSGDLVARLGGDEFVVMLSNVTSQEEALLIAARTRDALRKPFVVEGVELYISGSLGLSLAESGSDHSAEFLIRDADTAMYQAKAAGRDSVMVFNSEMRISVSRSLELKNDLRHAIERGELYLVYQPIVGTVGATVEGVEALLRWHHVTLGHISPSVFIPLAEESGQIAEIGEWVLREAVRQFSLWRTSEEVSAGLYLSVNISAVQLANPFLLPFVRGTLEEFRLPGEVLSLELTESVVMNNMTLAAKVLRELQGLRVKIALDDFGSGYSSLAYLRDLPIDRLKIDKAFIDPLSREEAAEETLIAAIVAMADSMGITTVAEGVESSVQARRVRDLGCTSIQGYLFSRPVKAAQLPTVFARLENRSDHLYA